MSKNENVSLTFSTDTVTFDTVFTSLESITQRLTVYNPEKNAITINRISLENRTNSPYSLIINGVPNNEQSDISILGEDSLLIFVKITVPEQDNDLPFEANDAIVFETGNVTQDVKLVTWGQDANFFRGGLQIVDCNTTWTADRPYIIYDSLLVDEGCTLTIEAGTRIHLAPNAFFFVAGSLQIYGTSENIVEFEGLRLDEAYEDIAGQWIGIFFLEGSNNNFIEWARIRNGVIGLRVGTPDEDNEPDLIVDHTIIENMSIAGLQCFTSDVFMTNSLINNCIENTVACVAGGNYTFIHNTFSNETCDFFVDQPSVIFSNYLPINETTELLDPLSVTMYNTILWGTLDDELELVADERAEFILDFQHNLIRTEKVDFNLNQNILNQDPKFMDPCIYDHALDTLSPAKDNGLETIYKIDLAGQLRDDQPDMGAYERIE